MTISEFLHNSISDFFCLKLLFCTTKRLKTQLCCGTVYLAKISIYVNYYFIGLPAPLENNATTYGITASEKVGSIRV